MFPAGEYYIGDLCYVMTSADARELHEKVFPSESQGCPVEGEHLLSLCGKIARFQTAYGDGCYLDQDGHEYSVDSGAIGCIATEDMRDDENVGHLGRIVTFKKPFSAYRTAKGTIVFASSKTERVSIKTGIEDPGLI